jgi:hypothetical protein
LILGFGTSANYSIWNSHQLLTADVVKDAIAAQAGGGWTVTTDTLAEPQVEAIGYTVYIHNLPNFNLPDSKVYNLMLGGSYMINYWVNHTTSESTSGSYMPVWWRNGQIENYQVISIIGSYPYTCNYITLPTHGEAILTIPDSVVSAGSWSPPSPSAYLAIEPDVTRLIPKAGIFSIDTNVRVRQLTDQPLTEPTQVPKWGDFSSSSFHFVNRQIALQAYPINGLGRIDVTGYVGATAQILPPPSSYDVSFRIDLAVNPADYDQFVYQLVVQGYVLGPIDTDDWETENLTGYVEFTSTALTSVCPHWVATGTVSANTNSVTVQLTIRPETGLHRWYFDNPHPEHPPVKVLCAGVTLGHFIAEPVNQPDPEPANPAA